MLDSLRREFLQRDTHVTLVGQTSYGSLHVEGIKGAFHGAWCFDG